MRIRQLSFVVVVLVSVIGTSYGQRAWSTKFSNLDLTGKVFSLLASGDTLYIGGTFESVAGIPARHVALWDGAAWHALGAGVNGAVYALAFDTNNKVLAGGVFDTAGSVPANSIATWDGASWSAMGKGVTAGASLNAPPAVAAIILTSSLDIYIGGGMIQNGEGDQLNCIAHWNGTKWEPLGAGITPLATGPAGLPGITSLAETKWGLAAGGFFTAAGGMMGSGVAFWSGGAWQAPIIDPGAQVNVTSMFYGQGSLVFAGAIATKWPTAPFISYNGLKSFAFPPTASGFPIGTVAHVGTTVYAGQLPGSLACDTCLHGVAAFEAGDWVSVAGGVDGTVTAEAATNRLLYVAGNFTRAGSTPSSGLAMFEISPPAEVIDPIRSPTPHSASILSRTGKVRIEGGSNATSVFDALGRVVVAPTFFSTAEVGSTTDVDLTRLPDGLYVITSGESVIRVMLQR